MKRQTLNTLLLVGLLLTINQRVNAETSFFNFGRHETTTVPAAVAEKISNTLSKLPKFGKTFSNIELLEGIRAMDGEVASSGEIKIMVHFDWQNLPDHPLLRTALDSAAAHIVEAVFSEHSAITKLRIILKIPEGYGRYHSAAKVFSFTRSAFELSQNNPHCTLNNPIGASYLLALGDYIVLTDQGWVRGY